MFYFFISSAVMRVKDGNRMANSIHLIRLLFSSRTEIFCSYEPSKSNVVSPPEPRRLAGGVNLVKLHKISDYMNLLNSVVIFFSYEY